MKNQEPLPVGEAGKCSTWTFLWEAPSAFGLALAAPPLTHLLAQEVLLLLRIGLALATLLDGDALQRLRGNRKGQ